MIGLILYKLARTFMYRMFLYIRRLFSWKSDFDNPECKISSVGLAVNKIERNENNTQTFEYFKEISKSKFKTIPNRRLTILSPDYFLRFSRSRI